MAMIDVKQQLFALTRWNLYPFSIRSQLLLGVLVE